MDKITDEALVTTKETTDAMLAEKIFLSETTVKEKLELDVKSLDMEIKLLSSLLKQVNESLYSSVSEIYQWLSFINPLLAESVTNVRCLNDKLTEERRFKKGVLDECSIKKIIKIIKAGINSAKDLAVKTNNSLNSL